MATRIYTTIIGDDEPIEELPADIISYGYRLNRSGAINFTLSLDHEKATVENCEPGVHEVVVERNKATKWRGPVLAVSEDDKGRSLNFNGEGLFHYPSRWFINATLQFTSIDIAVIARALINHHQGKGGGDFGIDTSGSETSRNADRTYDAYELKNVQEAIIQLSEVEDGIDFVIDPETRRFIVSYPKTGVRLENIVYDERNIREFSRVLDAQQQASQILGVGSGDAESTLTASQQDSSAVARYKLTQRVHSATDVTEQVTLNGHVAEQLDLWKDVPNALMLRVGTEDPDPFTAQCGDEIKINWDSPYKPVDEFQRLVGIDIVWNAGKEEAVLFTVPL